MFYWDNTHSNLLSNFIFVFIQITLIRYHLKLNNPSLNKSYLMENEYFKSKKMMIMEIICNNEKNSTNC